MKITDDLRGKFRERYEAGETCPEIADSLGVHRTTVRDALVAAGVEMDRRRRSKRYRARPIEERLAARTDRLGDCWVWTGRTNNHGYGQMVVRDGDRYVLRYTHRLAFEVAVRPLEPGEEVRHTCDNPPCCNPAHLVAGTRDDNMRDMVERGRHGFALSPETVQRIHEMTDAGTGGAEIARALGLPRGTVYARQHRYRRTGA
jgi:hypothetical protein